MIPITYSVAGRILDTDGRGLSGITVLATEGPQDLDPVVTDVEGGWVLDGIVDPVRVQPFRLGYTFDPPYRLLLGSTQDAVFSASYQLSGRVVDGNDNGLKGVTISFSDGETVLSDHNGVWKHAGLSGRVNIVATKEGYSFSPAHFQVFEPDDSLVFVSSYTVEGSLVHQDGRPIVGAM